MSIKNEIIKEVEEKLITRGRVPESLIGKFIKSIKSDTLKKENLKSLIIEELSNDDKNQENTN